MNPRWLLALALVVVISHEWEDFQMCLGEAKRSQDIDGLFVTRMCVHDDAKHVREFGCDERLVRVKGTIFMRALRMYAMQKHPCNVMNCTVVAFSAWTFAVVVGVFACIAGIRDLVERTMAAKKIPLLGYKERKQHPRAV